MPPFRVYLKTPNAPGQRAFSRRAASFFLEIRQYSCEKMSCTARKILAAGHIFSFQMHPSTLMCRVLISFVHIISPSPFFVNSSGAGKCYLFVNNAAQAAVTICSRISYIFNNLPLSFLISPCYDNDARSDMHFFIFPSYLFRSAVSELVTRLWRFLCRCAAYDGKMFDFPCICAILLQEIYAEAI